MRISVFLLLFLPTQAYADAEAKFLEQICEQGFTSTSIPRAESVRFCQCVGTDVGPRLNSAQRNVIRDGRSSLKRGPKIPNDLFVASGVRDLVVAGQARCEAAFYPPSTPITLKSGDLQMTLRCNAETRGPEILIHVRGGQLLTEKERKDIVHRMTQGGFDSEYAKVNLRINGRPSRTESWEIDLSGQIVSSLKPHELLLEIRSASAMSATISRGRLRYSGQFATASAIPARWVPCGGVTR